MTLSKDLRETIKRQYLEFNIYRKVAELNNWSPSLIRNIVLNLYKKERKKPGPKKKITPNQDEQIQRKVLSLISNSQQVTAPKLKRECNLNHVSVRTIRRQVKACGNVYGKAIRKIVLSDEQKAKRLGLAKEWLASRLDWYRVVFTDEKRFNCDGPDLWCS